MVKIRASVIGCGRMGAFTSQQVKSHAPKCWFPLSHIEAIKINNDLKIEAVCDKSKEALDKVKKKFKIQNCYRSFGQMIKNHTNEIICIATRTNEKLNIVKLATKKGVKYFHIEKPLCNSTDELRQYKRLAKFGSVFTYGAIRRYMKPYLDAKRIIDCQKLGKLMHIDVNFGYSQLYWTHPHSVDLILFFMNDEMPIYSQAYFNKVRALKKKNEIIVNNDPYVESALFIFKGNIVGNINNHGNCDVELHCEKGTIIVESDGARLLIKKKISGHPYKYKTKKITYNSVSPQGTSIPIRILSQIIKNRIKSYNMNHIFTGQQLLFSLIVSHINRNKLISPSKIKEKISIKGITNNNYA